MSNTYFRARPKLIEAQQITAENIEELAEWCSGTTGMNQILVVSNHGSVTANIGDWLIRSVDGEFYPCAPAVFEKNYEPVIE